MMRFGGARIWEPSEAERAPTGYLTNVSPVDSDTQPISIGVLSSHTREAGDEEASSSRAGPVKGMTEDLKDSSWPALVSCVLDDRVSNVDKTHLMKRQRGLFRFEVGRLLSGEHRVSRCFSMVHSEHDNLTVEKRNRLTRERKQKDVKMEEGGRLTEAGLTTWRWHQI